jgi:hypothetical protein
MSIGSRRSKPHRPFGLRRRDIWWSGRRDSNPRSLGPEPSAIPGFATSRMAVGESARSRTECTGEKLLGVLAGPSANWQLNWQLNVPSVLRYLIANSPSTALFGRPGHRHARTTDRGESRNEAGRRLAFAGARRPAFLREFERCPEDSSMRWRYRDEDDRRCRNA